MSEIVMNEGRDAVLLVGGGSLCAAAVPLLQAAGLVPAGVIHGPRCDFAAGEYCIKNVIMVYSS